MAAITLRFMRVVSIIYIGIDATLAAAILASIIVGCGRAHRSTLWLQLQCLSLVACALFAGYMTDVEGVLGRMSRETFAVFQLCSNFAVLMVVQRYVFACLATMHRIKDKLLHGHATTKHWWKRRVLVLAWAGVQLSSALALLVASLWTDQPFIVAIVYSCVVLDCLVLGVSLSYAHVRVWRQAKGKAVTRHVERSFKKWSRFTVISLLFLLCTAAVMARRAVLMYTAYEYESYKVPVHANRLDIVSVFVTPTMSLLFLTVVLAITWPSRGRAVAELSLTRRRRMNVLVYRKPRHHLSTAVLVTMSEP